MNTARTIDGIEVSFNLSFILYESVIGWTYFFDSSCSFFVSYVHGSPLVAHDLQYSVAQDMPSRALETASLNQYRLRPWCAPPIDQWLV